MPTDANYMNKLYPFEIRLHRQLLKFIINNPTETPNDARTSTFFRLSIDSINGVGDNDMLVTL